MNTNKSVISANDNQESSLLDLSHLSPDELEQLKKVLKKHQDFEKEIEQSISGLKKTLNYLTQQPTSAPETKSFNLSLKNLFDLKNSNVISASLSNINVSSSVICSMCKKTLSNNQSLLRFKWSLFSTNETSHKCNECNQLTCQKCGSMIAVDKWRCKVCILKRELAKKSGQWTLEQHQQQHQQDAFIDKINVTIANESDKFIAVSLPNSPRNASTTYQQINIQQQKQQQKQQGVKSESNIVFAVELAVNNSLPNTSVEAAAAAAAVTAASGSSVETVINREDEQQQQQQQQQFIGQLTLQSTVDKLNEINNSSVKKPRTSSSSSNELKKIKNNSVLKQLQATNYISNPLTFLHPAIVRQEEFIPPQNFLHHLACARSMNNNNQKTIIKSYLDEPLQMELSTPPPLLSEDEPTLGPLLLPAATANTTSNVRTQQAKSKQSIRNIKLVDSIEPHISHQPPPTNTLDSTSTATTSVENYFIPINQTSASNSNKTSTNQRLSSTKRTNFRVAKLKNKRTKSLISSQSVFTSGSIVSLEKKSESIESALKKKVALAMQIEFPPADHDQFRDLAQVLLIELNRSTQQQQQQQQQQQSAGGTNSQDSPISFQSFEANSGAQSLSSRQDSSMSVGNDQIIMSSSDQQQQQQQQHSRLRPISNMINETKKNRLRNSEEWHQRRKDLMKKTRKWTEVLENKNNYNNISDNNNQDEIKETFHDLSESFYTDDSSFMSDSAAAAATATATAATGVTDFGKTDDIQSIHSKSTVKHQSYYYGRSGNNQISIYHSDLSHQDSSAEINQSEISQNDDSNYSINNHVTSTNTTANAASATNASLAQSINLPTSANNVVVVATTRHRKLPKIPIKDRSADYSVNSNSQSDPPSTTTTTTSTTTTTGSNQNQRTTHNRQNRHISSSSTATGVGSPRRTRVSLDCESSLNKQKINNLESFSKTKNLSKSIDSIINEQNCVKNYLSLSFKSMQKSLNSPQRSIDYPYILRKTPKLSDIVRKRLLFQKVSRHATLFGDWCMNVSIEKEHVPKAVRKMVIRQDNSIEISLSRPRRLRQQTMSEDIASAADIKTATNELMNSNAMQGLMVTNQTSSMLSVSSVPNDRRKTIETCENIFLQNEESTKLRARTPPSNPHRILLYKDKSDTCIQTNGLGMRIIGGHEWEDGSLGCFVTLVVKGGPADMNSIEVGDQILEFNGRSLIDSTYEEVRQLQNNDGDYVQMVVQHNNIRSQFSTNGSPIRISRHFQTVPRLCQSSSRRRRNLPPLPSSETQLDKKSDNNFGYIVAETLQVPCNNTLRPILINRGRLLMQIWNDVDNSKLAITINQATNLPSRSESEQWYTYVIGRVIFEEQGVQNFQTKPTIGTNPVWSETFVFNSVEPIEDVNLEIYLHDTQTPSDTRILQENFIGMIMLPLSEANLEDEPHWYDMKDKPTRKNSNTSVTFKSSSNDSQDSLCEKRRKLSSRHSSRKSSSFKNESLSGSPLSVGAKMFSPVRKLSRVFSRLFNRRNSESGVKRNLIRFETEEDENIYPLEEQSSSSKTSRTTRRRHTELLTVNFLLPPDVIIDSSANKSTSNIPIVEAEEDIDYYFKSQLNNQTPGLGQVCPKLDDKIVLEELIVGDIKLGFVMSKGQLEITVFEARNLKKLDPNCKVSTSDTYVKTYLRTGTHRLQKRKTNVVRNSSEPVYNSKLLYNACNVLGRRIQVIMIWQKAPKLDKNQCIGETFIQLDYLDLSHQTIGWYKLYKQHAVESDFYDST